MKKQTVAILSILAVGSFLSIAYATGSVITNNYIITPTLNATNINVSGTCGGCGTGDGSFSTYSLITNTTVAITGSAKGAAAWASVTPDGMYIGQAGGSNGVVYFIDSSGSLTSSSTIGGQSGSNPQYVVHSIGSTYYGVVEATGLTTGELDIYKNHVLLQSFPFNFSTDWWHSPTIGLACSPDGKYFELLGIDSTDTTTRFQVYEGS